MNATSTSRRGGNRVVITGMGWVTPLGCDLDGAWSRMLAGESAVGPVSRFDAGSFGTNFAAEVKGFRLEDHLPAEAAARHESGGLHTQFALASAEAAWRQSGLSILKINPRMLGIYFGAGEGPVDHGPFFRANMAAWAAESRDLDTARWAEAALELLAHRGEVEQEPHAALCHLADRFGARGPSYNCMTACAASTQAVGEAFEILRRGDADVMLAGGAHSMIHPLGMTGFIRLTAMSKRRDDFATAARPFDRTRDGFVMGEGAGTVVLETLDHARARGANILAEVAGYGSTADAYRITDIHPDGRGGAAAMKRALEQAGIDPAAREASGRPQVHYISAHGTGTPENDGTETRAVKSVFGELAGEVPFSSIKSMTGHLIQAAGAVELMTCVMAIRTGMVPPTINLHNPDPDCDLDYVPLKARDVRGAGGVGVCLSNGFGFGGQNDCVCVRGVGG